MIGRDFDSLSLSFFVFQYIPFTKKSEEDTNILTDVLYQYKNILTDEELNNYLNAIVSLHTFSTVSLKDKSLNFLSFDLFKISIHTILLKDNSLVFFALRLTNELPDQVIQNTLELIIRHIFFYLGETFQSDVKILKSFLEKNGTQIIDLIINPKNLELFKYNVSFPSLENIKNDSSAILIATFLSSLNKLNSKIWGTSCFLNDKILISQLPISLSFLFRSVPNDLDYRKVYLNKNQINQIIENSPFDIEKIPDGEIVPSQLFIFSDFLKKIRFYVLADISFSDGENINLKKAFNSAFPFIYENSSDILKTEKVDNTVSYDSCLMDLILRKTSPAFDENVTFAKNEFLKDNRLTQIIMKSPSDFTICYRILSFEHFSFVEDNGKDSFLDLYKKCISLNPSLMKYISEFAPNELL